MRRDAAVGDDGATAAGSEAGAFGAEAFKEAGTDLDLVTALAERNVDDTHGSRIKAGGGVASFRFNAGRREDLTTDFTDNTDAESLSRELCESKRIHFAGLVSLSVLSVLSVVKLKKITKPLAPWKS